MLPERKRYLLLPCLVLILCLIGSATGFSEETSMTLPAEVSIIESGVFMNDTSITKVTIPERTEAIGDYAFYGCTNLTEVIIENNETTIGEDAFAACSPDLIIYGYSDASLARTYALANNITFVPIWSWSDWTTVVPGGDVESQSKIQYRSRSIGTETVYSEWSAWQSNGATAISANDLREVKTVYHPAVTKTIYHYNRYNYRNASGQTYLSYASGYANSMGFSGYWEYKDTESKLPNYKVYDGSHQAYGNSSDFWFNESTSAQTVTEAYTEYQYRTRTTSQVTVYGNWTVWGDDELTPSSEIQVENRTVYRTFGKTAEQSQIGHPVAIPEGMYTIRAASGKVIDVSHGHHVENTSVTLHEDNGGNNQKFILSSQPDNWYLMQVYDGLTVGIDGGSAKLCSVTSSSTLRWRFISAGSGRYYIENGGSGYLACTSDGRLMLAESTEEAEAWTLSATSLHVPSLEDDSTAGFAVGNISQSGATFTWTDVIGVDSFNIHIAKDGSEIHLERNAASGYTYSSLSPNTTYTAWLEGVNSTGSACSAVKTFTTKSNLPVVEFTQASISVNENLAFSVGVRVTNYNNSALAISLNTTDPKLDIVETKFTGPNQTLKTLFDAGIIKEVGGGYSNSADLQNSTSRTFYLSSGSGTLHIGGNYVRTANTVTLTINDSPNGTYTVGANRTLVIHYVDVDGNKPNKNNYSSKEAYVAACATWLNAKFPSGKYWNHPVGTICDDDNITSVSCTTHTHGSDNAIYSTSCFTRGVVPGDSICMNFAHYNSAQCMGFALKVGKDIFGSSATSGYWTNLGATGSLQAGDYVRIKNHSLFVLSVNGSQISTLECNNGANCIIHRHTRTVSGTTIDGNAIEQVRRINSWK